MKHAAKRLAAYFRFEELHTGLGRELRAGLTTFLSMAYILFVNPTILGEGVNFEGAFPQLLTATALAAAFGSLMMGLVARLPFALAPGMGLNAYFTYAVVQGQGVPWPVALGAVFISGLLFLAISVTGLRRILVDAIPGPLRAAATAGIGCFLAMIGLTHAGVVVDHPVTLVALGKLHDPQVGLALSGLLITLALMVRRVPGAVLLGILATTLVAVVSGAPVYRGEPFGGFGGGLVRAPIWPTDLFLALDLRGALDLGLAGIVFTFLFVDFFDSTGTLIALARKAGMAAPDEPLPRARSAYGIDALATAFGALVGTSSTTAYIESAAGIEEGGRSGMTAIVVAGLFLAGLFLWPLAAAVPLAATAPALIVIGGMMMFTTRDIDWENPGESVPALLTILGMPLTYSITNGLALGIVAYAAVQLLAGKPRKQGLFLYLLAAVLVVRFAFLAGT